AVAARGHRPGPRQQRRLLHGPLRGADPRLVHERDVRGRAGRVAVRAAPAAGQREPSAGRVADVRHHLPAAPLRCRRQAGQPRDRHRVPQRRAGARPRGDVRPHGAHGAPAVRAARGPPAARAPGPRSAGAVPQHLDPRPRARGAADVTGRRSRARPDRWNVTTAEARELQLQLRERLITHPPRGFAPRLVAGADLSIQRFARRGYAGIVVIDAETFETVDEATAAVDVTFPYVPGLLSFRELPAVAAAWRSL